MPRNAGNSFGLKRFEGNRPLMEQLTADRLNALIDMCEMNRVLYGKNTYGRRLPGGTTVNAKAGGTASRTSYPWHIYNTTKGSTGQVQLNGGDGELASLNDFTSTVGGNPTDTKTGSPPAYPQISVTGNGAIILTATPTTAGTGSPLASLSVAFFATGSYPSPFTDTANPATFFNKIIATISNYAVDGMGNVSFDVNNTYGSEYGPSTLIYCSGAINVY